MEILTGIAGGLVGAFGTDLFQRVTAARDRSKVRAALKIEIERNYHALCHFWKEADRELTDEELFNAEADGKIKEFHLPESAPGPILRITGADLPQWSLRIWESHIGTAALALKRDVFNNVYQFYDSLPQIAGIYSTLSELDEDNNSERLNKLWFRLNNIVKKSKALAQQIGQSI